MSISEVRVRIAPSPTGYFHVGTARCAIYNWLFARKHGGKFLLRIEDTDESRSKKEYLDVILDGLKWMGLHWDEDIVYQSRRMDSYAPHAERLLKGGRAYRCFCTPEELKQKRERAQREKKDYRYDKKCRKLADAEIAANLKQGRTFTIRLKLPSEGEALFDDLVYGSLRRAHADLDDLIILKSDGRPIYNFAVVADDHDMGVTHVIRGNDHVVNTFYQMEIYRALGWDIPQFGHLPLILRPDRAKVSKRKGDKGVTEYAPEGFLPDPFVNYLALVGWSPKDDREIMTRAELIGAFTLDGVNPNNAIFDVEKLRWFNGEYIRSTDDNKLVDLVSPFWIEAGLTTKYWIETNWHWAVKVVSALKERCKVLADFARLGGYFFKPVVGYDQKGVLKHFAGPDSADLLNGLRDRYARIGRWDKESLEANLRSFAQERKVKPAAIIHPTRLAVSGLTGGPGLFDILYLLGRQEVQARLDRAIEYIEAGGFPEQ
jgi:glutamyl-tRNA synthetase